MVIAEENLPQVSHRRSPTRARVGWLPAFMVFVALAATTVLVAATGAGAIAKLLYLAGALALGAIVLKRDPWDYLLLTLWIWTLTPLVRRLVDEQAGFDPTSLVLAAPSVAALAMLPSVLRRAPLLDSSLAFFPGLAALCILYGFIVSLLTGNMVAGLVGLVDWGIPLLHCFFILVHRCTVAGMLDRLPWFVATSLLLLGAYGIFQYLDPPYWDRDWMVNSEMDSIGEPEPLLVRVFGTLNAPGPYGEWMMALLVLSLAFRCWLTLPAQAIGAFALLLSEVRTSWGGLGLALIIILSSVRRVNLPSLSSVAVATAVIALVGVTYPDVAGGFLARMATLANLPDDGSAVARLEGHVALFNAIDETPFGFGLGAFGRGAAILADYRFGAIDSGPIEVILSLGWFAGTLYCLALTGTFLYGMPRWRQAGMIRHRVLFAAGAACFFHFPITNLVALPGAAMWVMFGLAIAAKSGLSHATATAAAPPVAARSPVATPS